jgi:hypothetical protein
MLSQEASDDDEQSQEESHHLAFQNLPDLLPELFESESDSPTLIERFSNRTYSTYRVWESTSDLKSQNGAVKSSFNESHAGNGGRTNNSISVRSDDVAHSKNKTHQVLEDVDDSFTFTPRCKIENLRHIVRAYSPRGCDIDDIEKDQLEFDSISITAEHSVQDNNWSLQLLDQLNDFTVEAESLDIESRNGSDDEDSINSYALLQDYVAHKPSPSSDVIDDVTSRFSSRSSNSEESQDVLELSNDKQRGLRKTISKTRMVKELDQIDIFSSTVDDTPLKIRRQKRSNIRRRRAAARSSNQSGNGQMLRWYSMTGHSDTEYNIDGRHIAAATTTGCRTKKRERKSNTSVAATKKLTSYSKAVHTAE